MRSGVREPRRAYSLFGTLSPREKPSKHNDLYAEPLWQGGRLPTDRHRAFSPISYASLQLHNGHGRNGFSQHAYIWAAFLRQRFPHQVTAFQQCTRVTLQRAATGDGIRRSGRASEGLHLLSVVRQPISSRAPNRALINSERTADTWNMHEKGRV